MLEQVAGIAAMVVLVVGTGGALAAQVSRETGTAIVLLVGGILGFLSLSNYPAVNDWVQSHVLSKTTSKPAELPSRDHDVPNQWLPICLVGGGLLASFGLYGLWGQIQRYRGRRSASLARVAATQERRHAIEAEHDEVREAYAAYVCDILAVLDRPALDDVTVPQTAAFLHAMDAAADARRGSDLDTYRQTVSALKTAWRAADDHAHKSGLRHLPAREHSAITKARRLFEKALDERGSRHERQAAHAKARSLLDGVLALPKQAVAAVEHQTRPALTKDATA